MDIITFIIPSIGRNTLFDSINSLMNQTSDNWKAIIIFDGCKNILNKDDINNKFIIHEIDKTNCVINQASDVRNFGLQFVTSKWVGFLDDDDTISTDYVEYFFKQKNIFNFDLFIYRMINKDLKIFPSLLSKDLIPCDVGISFIVKKEIFEKIKFENSHCEDYDFLNLVKKNKYLILISNTTKYFVKSNLIDYKNQQLEFNEEYKVFINGINPFCLLNFYLNL
tara:strand:- start:1764 stop:2432 length:669 start_codon:yes stop_codon:yes gene_type:complete